MALKYCLSCERGFSAERKACPRCGALIAGSGRADGSSARTRKALALAFALGVISVYTVLTRETGPAPELEALHSAEDAIAKCREGIESRLSDRSATVQGLLEAEYLQGGEYRVRGAVSVVDGRRRVTSSVLCEAQFRSESGWTIEHVEVGS